MTQVTMMTEVTTDMDAPSAWFAETTSARAEFCQRLRASSRPILICDYDGTLAPFMADKMQALPYPGVMERLERIHAGRTRLAFVSGRPIEELLTLVPLASEIEVWGSHGREHRSAEGSYRLFKASDEAAEVLDRVEAALIAAGYGREIERKTASLAVHWRNLDRNSTHALERTARDIFAAHAGHAAFAVMPFESGMELRVADRTKAHAVDALLESEPQTTSVAYLGDDTTDEDAFRALNGRGLSLLVRPEPRPTSATAWLRPPGELLRFLDEWLEAVLDAREESRG
jgi:trehalose-phosphatase